MKSDDQRTILSRDSIRHFEMTLTMFNESMGMCLPTTLTLKREPLATD